MKKYIGIACRKYEWSSVTNGPAPYPPFDPLKVNESKILHDERCKEADLYIEDEAGYVDWLTQESRNPSPEFNAEIIRAFKANGLPIGAKIHVTYDMRGEDDPVEYELEIR